MQPARLPDNETERLAVLRAYEILDTPEEETYDELTRLAGTLCGVPLALITFIEEQRQWFKSAVGTDLREAQRPFSFCQYALLQNDVFEVSNAQEDPRFADSPVVVGAPNLRFYAGQPLLAPGGEAIGTLCVFDMQPRKLTPEQTEMLRVLARQVMHQLELRRTLKELALAHQSSLELGALKDDFMRIASHDLKNPLMVMMGASSMLSMTIQPGAVVSERDAKLPPMLHDSSVKMQRIIEDFLEFRAVADGQLKLKPRSVDFNALAADGAESQREYATGKQIVLTFEAASDLPALTADPDRLRQVVNNFIGNAIKFSPANTCVTVRIRTDDGNVIFEVQDQGPGLSDEDMPKLFTNYAKLSNKPTGGEHSSGIGLYICKQLIEAHGGTVGACNVEGAGAMFWFAIPPSPPE